MVYANKTQQHTPFVWCACVVPFSSLFFNSLFASPFMMTNKFVFLFFSSLILNFVIWYLLTQWKRKHTDPDTHTRARALCVWFCWIMCVRVVFFWIFDLRKWVSWKWLNVKEHCRYRHHRQKCHLIPFKSFFFNSTSTFIYCCYFVKRAENAVPYRQTLYTRHTHTYKCMDTTFRCWIYIYKLSFWNSFPFKIEDMEIFLSAIDSFLCTALFFFCYTIYHL